MLVYWGNLFADHSDAQRSQLATSSLAVYTVPQSWYSTYPITRMPANSRMPETADSNDTFRNTPTCLKSRVQASAAEARVAIRYMPSTVMSVHQTGAVWTWSATNNETRRQLATRLEANMPVRRSMGFSPRSRRARNRTAPGRSVI